MTVVLAFDRDWTVDVNPHPTHEAVPLEWVRYWAHETEHEVWAIGNQDLVEEADIPGTVESIRRRDGHIDALGSKDVNGYYEWWPERDQRLQILAELYPEADEHVVIDDLDLRHVDGWTHYHAWDFLEAIEDGSVDIEPPDEDEPVTDGGYASGEEVEEILSEGYVFELAYRKDDETMRKLVTHFEPDRPSMKPLEGPPAFWFKSMGAGERFSVRLPDIEAIHPVPDEQIPDPFKEEFVTAVRADIRADDETVDPETIRTLLSERMSEPTSVSTTDALGLAMNTLGNREDVREIALEAAFNILEGSDEEHIAKALKTVWTHTEDEPKLLQPYVSDLATYVSTEAEYQQPATRCVMEVATEWPGEALDAVPALEIAAGVDDLSTKRFAIYALSCVADEHPGAVFPTRVVLIEAIQTGDDNLQKNALAALGKIASSYPGGAEPIVDEVADLLDDEDKQIRNNAVGLLGDISREHPEIVIEHADAIARRLDDNNIQARINASLALQMAGEADPSAIRGQKAHLEDSLWDPSPEVRANVCQLIGNAYVDVPIDDLREVAEEDRDERVRERADWAIYRLNRMDNRSP